MRSCKSSKKAQVKATKAWTLKEERYVFDNASKVTLADMSRTLNRSKGSIKKHAHDMRARGVKVPSLRPDWQKVEFHSQLEICPMCGELRLHFNAGGESKGICRICSTSQLVEEHRERTAKIQATLPKVIRESTRETLDTERGTRVKHPLVYPKHQPPKGEGEFWKALENERYTIALEEYEIQRNKLDIDAYKQRVCKWRKKIRKYENNQYNPQQHRKAV